MIYSLYVQQELLFSQREYFYDTPMGLFFP